MSEKAACIEVFPHLQAAADVVTATAKDPDGSSVDRKKLDDTVDGLKHVASVAPLDMVPALREQIEPLETLQTIFRTGQDQTLNFENFRSSGFDLLARCDRYAN